MAARLIPAGVSLRSAFNQIAPGRDKASDGWIGDIAHQQEEHSDHNPDDRGLVHAIDVDADLREPGLTMEAVVQHLLDRCQAGREVRLTYIIYRRRIWSASRGWIQRVYTGPSAHFEHAHFSLSYAPLLEALTGPWHLEDTPMALTDPDKTWITNQIAERIIAAIPRIADAVAAEVYAYNRQQTKPADSDTAEFNRTARTVNAVLAGQPLTPIPTPK